MNVLTSLASPIPPADPIIHVLLLGLPALVVMVLLNFPSSSATKKKKTTKAKTY